MLVDRAGQTFNGVPKWMTHLAVQYSFPVEFRGPSWLQGWLTPRLEWYYQSEVHWDFVELAQATQSGFNLLHARLSYDFWDDHAQVALWAKNMLDEEYFEASLSLANVTGTLSRFYSPPALFGAELSYRF
jgi:outer membrane receptor protein involved in Fe transport